MAKIIVNNPRQVINGGAKKYYFKVKGLGGPKGDKGDKGDTGSQGPQGPQGNAATVSIGSTTTLPVGYDATVTNSGSIYNAVLNFGIPQGPRGPQGATGATGAKGDKGDQGNPGPQGEKGTNATVYVGTTSTLNPGSQATVYNSGTDSNAVLNFGIPKGEKGDTGPMPTIAQTTGQAIDQVMSQKATTDALNTKQATITSSNKLSADLVDDTSTTNKFVTASDITTWNGKQDALTAGTGIDITGGVISTPAIVPEVVAELPTTGAEGKLYLTPKAHTTSTATGNPIEATVTAQAGQLESFQLDGDTFQQSYTGKNLFDISKNSNAIHNEETSGVIVSPNTLRVTNLVAGAYRYYFVPLPDTSAVLGKTITLSIDVKLTNAASTQLRFMWASDGWYTTSLGTGLNPTSDGTYTVTVDVPDSIPSGSTRLTVGLYGSGTSSSPVNSYVEFSNIQVEIGSSNTSYEPYTGGQPSPNPDYPQTIQTVTGLQTISINGTNYPLDLGSIELCKLDTYQDYIYKNGDDWKVHKATATITLDGTEAWVYADNYNYARCPSYTFVDKPRGGTSVGLQLSNYFGVIADWGTFRDSTGRNAFFPLLDEGYKISIRNTGCSSVENYKSWFAANKPSFYYPVATPTDTTITDATLIAQLEAIRTALLQNGANTITNTATGTNLAGDMEIGYYGYNPTNRYDKFIWLDLNNNYEQIGS